MLRLNKSGLSKLKDFLGGDLSICKSKSGYLLKGKLNESVKIDGVIFENVGEDYHRVLIEQDERTDIDPSGVKTGEEAEIGKQGFDITDEGNVKALAIKLSPYLSAMFPTKEEMNTVLAEFKNDFMGSEEFINFFKTMLQKVKREKK
jgi:hypothetical protein